MDERDLDQIERAVEAILFASTEPMSLRELERRLPDGAPVKAALDALINRYELRGVNLRKMADTYAFRTSIDMENYLRNETSSERKLSRAAIETLAIIAYHQPTTRGEIEEIRGVAVSKGTLDQLLSLEWIRLGKRRETPGRPITFLTTTQFLDHFGLSSAKDLPGIKELREAGLLERSPLDDKDDTEDQMDTETVEEFEGHFDDLDFDDVIDDDDI